MGLHYKGPKYVPDLKEIPTNTVIDKMAIEAELEYMDSGAYFMKILGNELSAERYRHLAEVYAQEYENHYQSLSTLLHVEGVVVEMYSDIYKFEKEKGETPKSKYQKHRLLLLRNGLENLKRLYTNYDSLKIIHKHSVMERARLSKENEEFRVRIMNIELAEKFNGREENKS